MSNEKLQEVLQLLSDQYKTTAPAITENTIKLWLNCFKDCEDSMIDEAVVECIKKNRYCPTIAEILEEINNKKAYIREQLAKVRYTYELIMDRWGVNDYEKYYEHFKESIKSTNLDLMVRRAEWIGRLSLKYINEDAQVVDGYKRLRPFNEWLDDTIEELVNKEARRQDG